MALITLNEVRKSFGALKVLDDVSFTVGTSEKVALVGPNASGKTTILRLIVGLDEPDSGRVEVLRGTSIGFMPQDTELVSDKPLLEEVWSASSEVKRLEADMRRLEIAMETADETVMPTLIAEYGEVRSEFERLGGYAFEAEVKSALAGLELGPDHWNKPVSLLSGGQKARAALAKLLLQKPDVLLLDEPTNHLDIQACEWLEEFLQGFPGAVVVVSHDRYFLDKVVTKVVALHDACARSYPGNYTAYARQKEELLRQQVENYERQQQEIERLEEFIRRYRAGQRHNEAKSRQKQLAKMVRLKKPKTAPSMHVHIAPAVTSGHVVMKLLNVGKSFGEKPLFSGLNIVIENGDRVGLVGPNGAGKTTLLRMILGDETTSEGSIELGYNVDIGYFAQDAGDLDEDNSVLGEILETADLTPAEARAFLAKFLFSGDEVFKTVRSLSGGERNRLALAKLVLQKPNLLILDEPTNHLDIDAREALDKALKNFEGTIILSSHDRYLLNSVVTRIIELKDGAAQVFEGNYDFFTERAHATQTKPIRKKPKPHPPKQQKQLSTPQPKGPRPEDIEREIETAEARLAEITDLLSKPDTYLDGGSVPTLEAEYNELSARIQQLYEQWEELTN